MSETHHARKARIERQAREWREKLDNPPIICRPRARRRRVRKVTAAQ